MNNKFLRQWTMLRSIPISRKIRKRITTRQLMDALSEKGFDVTQRTIQRDLKALAKIVPGLQTDGHKEVQGWFWKKDTFLLDVPAMDVDMALAFQLAKHFLKNMFPPAILGQLEPYFETSKNVFEGVDNTNYPNWDDKVRILTRTQPLIPASIHEDTVAVIYEALFKEKQFRGRYVRRDGDEVEYDIHPLGLIFRESVIYLVATIWDYQDPRHLALHRFKHCDLLENNVVAPEDFDLDNYLKKGSFEYCEKDDEMIRLKVLFSNWAGHHLLETPVSSDQQTSEKGEGQFLVEATVKDSGQLRWWLMGFGGHVEVLEPEGLREEFSAVAQKLLALYQDSENQVT